MKLALKIDVDTLRGTREGAPRLVEILRRYGAGASFLFSLGPDRTGRSILRALRPGSRKKVSRASVIERYGALLYGALLPSPDIGRECAQILRQVRDAGFEVGIHTYNPVKWQDFVASADCTWTEREMALAVERFAEIFGEPARTHGAAGWQMNRHALRLTQRLGFDYCSDTRGTHPFIPVVDAEIMACPQLPTTLPTLDELIGEGLTADNVHERLLGLTLNPPPTGHVYTLHAELEGMKLAQVFERLLAGWSAQGFDLVSTREVFESLDPKELPYHRIVYGEVPGSSGARALQGPSFLA